MRKGWWAVVLGAGLLLNAPAWAASGTAENLDFRLTVEKIDWTATGFVVRAQIENRTGSPDLFLHHEAGVDDAEGFEYMPTATPKPGAPRNTFTLKGLTSSRYTASLAFGLKPGEEAGVLIAGESRPPYRQVAIALKSLLPERPTPAPIAKQTPAEELDSGEEPAPEPGVIQRFMPPHPSFGDSLVLMDGTPGPRGEGWSRIYTELPDVTLADLKRVLERPAQIWRGNEGFLYLRNIGGQRALAIEVRGERVISARYVTPATLAQVLGPRTRFPKRVYMGRP